jgi:hypothetical protein
MHCMLNIVVCARVTNTKINIRTRASGLDWIGLGWIGLDWILFYMNNIRYCGM